MSERPRHFDPAFWLALAGFAVCTVMVVTSPLPTLLDAILHDDSFYYLTTAENMAAGYGSSFDRINPTNGYHPLWFGILTLLAAVVDHDQFVRVSIVAQAALMTGGLFVIYAVMLRQRIAPPIAGVAIGGVFVAIVPILGWDLLETGLNVLTSALLLWSLVKLRDEGVSPFWLGLVVSVAFLARTDHAFYLPLVFGLLVWQDRRLPMPERVRRVVAFGLPVGLLVGSYLLSNLVTTGHLMPVSGRVKAYWAQTWTLEGLWKDLFSLDLRQVWKLGAVGGLWYVVRDVAARQWSAVGVYAVGGLLLLGYYSFFQVNGSLVAFWYFVPLYLVFCVAVADVLQRLATMAGTRGRVLQGVAVAALTVALALRATLLLSYRDRPDAERSDIYRLAQVLNERRAQNDGSAASWDAGILGFYAGPVTNLDGLANSSDYFERYQSQGRAVAYVNEHKFRYVLSYEYYLPDGKLAQGLLDTYRITYTYKRWVILEPR